MNQTRTAAPARLLAAVAASWLLPAVALGGANATAEVAVTAIRLVAPRLSAPTGQTQVVAGAPQSCVFNACAGERDAVALQVVGDASAEVLAPGERARVLATGAGGVPGGGLVRVSTQADGVLRAKADAGARGQFTFAFLSAASCTTVTLSVDYTMLQDLRSQPGPERAFGDQSLDVLIQNRDMGSVQDTDSIRIVNDRFSGDNVLATPSGTLTVTVPCSGVDQIGGRITWFAAAIAQASSPAPGQTAGAPLMPTGGGAGAFTFPLVVGTAGIGVDFPLFIDPPAATGYAYAVADGEPRFASVLIPEPLPVTGDDRFRVVFGAVDQPLVAGTPFSFTDFVAEGVPYFEIRDIDPAEQLDPGDPLAFVTGITFATAGAATVTMTPLVPPCGDDGECDDGVFCNGAERCVAGGCEPGMPPDCGSLADSCHAGVCDEVANACVAAPANDGGDCDDGDPCTVGDACRAGVCAGGETAPECLPPTTTTSTTTTITTTSTTTSSTTTTSTTTSTLPGTTTSTLAPTTTTSTRPSSTTTTLPAPVPCDLPAFAGVLCRLEAASRRPECDAAALEAKLARMLGTGFDRATSFVRRAEAARAPRRRRALIGKADAALRQIVRAARQAAKQKPGILPCATGLGTEVDSLRPLLAALRSSPAGSRVRP